MKAAVLYEPNKPLVIEDLHIDPPKAGEVKVKVAANGACHSDLHVMTGDMRMPLPMVLGHEGAGVVAEVGAGVTSVKEGDHVVLSFNPVCGTCHYCTQGQPHLCETRPRALGTLLDGQRACARTTRRFSTLRTRPRSRRRPLSTRVAPSKSGKIFRSTGRVLWAAEP